MVGDIKGADLMRALSIRQPWAWAILHANKDVENRDWKPGNSARRHRGPFLIHASSGMTRDEYENGVDTLRAVSRINPFLNGFTFPPFEHLPRGGIVGRATLVDIVTESDSPWFFGSIGLMLADVAPTHFVPMKGALGFFDVPPDIVKRALGHPAREVA
jgi:hypothetical protein